MMLRPKTVDKQISLLYDELIREIQNSVHIVHSDSFCQIFLNN